ncbi:antimicrobial peptide motif protein [Ranid herpesvirus 3]|uniref:Antimicrobial peptide motif protein n=1 Tax=Ranid herpesvirus 3 TaxID=1987509 RepID=A0A1X9T5C9_9VIRU|nr:antimicrobial peptide motif protein [Ranid herpesvirus 3]ARR28906.1 antimicrobial peptide motif protein [Ranid herpesvirus 3]
MNPARMVYYLGRHHHHHQNRCHRLRRFLHRKSFRQFLCPHLMTLLLGFLILLLPRFLRFRFAVLLPRFLRFLMLLLPRAHRFLFALLPPLITRCPKSNPLLYLLMFFRCPRRLYWLI